MALSSVTGPLVVSGNTNPQQLTEGSEGPSLFADGVGVVDPRLAVSLGSGAQLAYGMMIANDIAAIDAFPQTKATNNVVAAQGAGAASGTVLTLASGTVQSAVANVPIVPWVQTTDTYGNRAFTPQAYSSANVVTAPLTFDFGYCAGTTFTSATVTLSTSTGPCVGVVPASYAGQTVNKNQIIQLQTTNHLQPELMFLPGDYIIVANAGNAGGTVPLITQVLAIDYANHYVYVANAAQSAVTNGGIANANLYGATPGVAYWPWQQFGSSILVDPRQSISRTLQYVSTNAGDTTVTITVKGWDIYSVPMTETITLNGTTIVNGKKAFKSIQSVTTGVASLVGNVNIGTTDTLGLSIRADSYSYLTVYVSDAGVTANTGFTKADLTAPATATSGDVRGTYALQTASDGTKRVAIWVNPSQYQWEIESNLVQQPIFGSAQF